MTELERLREFNAWLESDEGKASLRKFGEGLAEFAKTWKPVRPIEEIDWSKFVVPVRFKR